MKWVDGCKVVVAVLMLGGAGATAQDRAVNLDYVIGAHDSVLNPDVDVQFFIRFTNNSATKYNISNGFELYSPDGAIWAMTEVDTFAEDLSVPLSGANFGFGSAIFKYSLDGSGHDTVGFFAQGLPTNTLLPAGFDGQIGSITAVGLRSQDDGLHLCIDTVTFFPPGGAWKWVNELDQQYPSWNTSGPHHTAANDGGPICFEIHNCGFWIGLEVLLPSSVGPCSKQIFEYHAYGGPMYEWEIRTVYGSTGPAEIVESDYGSASVEWTPTLDDAGNQVWIEVIAYDGWGCSYQADPLSASMIVLDDSPCIGRTGNVDFLGIDPNEVDSSDLGVLVSFLLGEPGSVPLCSQGEADVDAQGGANPIDSSDLGLLVSYLFSPPGTVTLPDCL